MNKALKFSQQSQQNPAQSPNTKAKNIANAVAGALGIDMSLINESGISGRKILMLHLI